MGGRFGPTIEAEVTTTRWGNTIGRIRGAYSDVSAIFCHLQAFEWAVSGLGFGY